MSPLPQAGLKEPQLQCRLGVLCGWFLATSSVLGLGECSGICLSPTRIWSPLSFSPPQTSEWASHLLMFRGSTANRIIKDDPSSQLSAANQVPVTGVNE